MSGICMKTGMDTLRPVFQNGCLTEGEGKRLCFQGIKPFLCLGSFYGQVWLNIIYCHHPKPVILQKE